MDCYYYGIKILGLYIVYIYIYLGYIYVYTYIFRISDYLMSTGRTLDLLVTCW